MTSKWLPSSQCDTSIGILQARGSDHSKWTIAFGSCISVTPLRNRHDGRRMIGGCTVSLGMFAPQVRQPRVAQGGPPAVILAGRTCSNFLWGKAASMYFHGPRHSPGLIATSLGIALPRGLGPLGLIKRLRRPSTLGLLDPLNMLSLRSI